MFLTVEEVTVHPSSCKLWSKRKRGYSRPNKKNERKRESVYPFGEFFGYLWHIGESVKESISKTLKCISKLFKLDSLIDEDESIQCVICHENQDAS